MQCWYEVHDDGYSVFVGNVHEGKIEEEYHAGNSPWDSIQHLPPDHPEAVDKRTFREWAKDTAEEMAEEYGAQLLGEVE